MPTNRSPGENQHPRRDDDKSSGSKKASTGPITGTKSGSAGTRGGGDANRGESNRSGSDSNRGSSSGRDDRT